VNDSLKEKWVERAAFGARDRWLLFLRRHFFCQTYFVFKGKKERKKERGAMGGFATTSRLFATAAAEDTKGTKTGIETKEDFAKNHWAKLIRVASTKFK
jgi:hypothetical protein